MQKENGFVLSNNYYSKRLNITSILNLVTDALQRTCTGTIVIDLEGSGWPETSTKDSTPGVVTDTIPSETSNTDIDITTNEESDKENGGGGGGGGGSGGGGGGGTDTWAHNPSDNVHFGPAGIGLLIMGFLVLGCKYFNSPIYMCYPKKSMERR